MKVMGMVGRIWVENQARYWRDVLDQVQGNDWLSRKARGYLDWILEGGRGLLDFPPLCQVLFSIWLVRLAFSLSLGRAR